MEQLHDSVQSKFVCGGSRLLDLKPCILLGTKLKEQYMIAPGLTLTGWCVLDLSEEALCSKMLLGIGLILCHEKKMQQKDREA